jgi:hypothetical protein
MINPSGRGKEGEFVIFRAEMDLLVIISSVLLRSWGLNLGMLRLRFSDVEVGSVKVFPGTI